MWEISNDSQVLNFILAVALGFVFCLAYDILRAYRATSDTSAISVFFGDLIFFSISAFLTFFFLLITTNGELRLYIILGILCGFFIVRLTVSLYIFRFFKWIFARVKASILKLLNAVFSFLKKTRVKYDIFLKNMMKIFKKLLKMQ